MVSTPRFISVNFQKEALNPSVALLDTLFRPTDNLLKIRNSFVRGTMKQFKALKINRLDNVAILLQLTPRTSSITVIGHGPLNIVANQDIPYGHKVALKSIKKKSTIMRYGEVICVALNDIQAGDWVHKHNAKPIEELKDVF